jgi:hypothetical protein
VSGREATKQLLDEAAREEFVAVALVARALQQNGRRVLRDWKKRNYPVTRIGRTILLHAPLVVRTYFPHAVSGHS